MLEQGTYEVFDFNTDEAEFDVKMTSGLSQSRLMFRRIRKDKPDDFLIIFLKTEWLEKISMALAEPKETGDADEA